MLGSQAIGLTASVAGLDIGVPEVFRFGYAHFPTAVATRDSWTEHDGAEIVFMLEGEACWELDTGLLLRLCGGQGALFTRHCRHRIANGLYPPGSAFWIVLAGAGQAAPPALLTQESSRLFQQDLGRRGLIRKISGKCLASIRQLTGLLGDGQLYTGQAVAMAEVRAHLHLVLVETWKAHRYRQPVANTPDIVDQVLEAMHDSVGHSVSISQLARKIGCSRGHLHNRFRGSVGMPPGDYAQRLRIRESCRRLTDRTASITDIALENGFSSSQHFSRVFKRYMGVTPSGYRSQRQNRRHKTGVPT